MGIEDWGFGLSGTPASILHCIINLSGQAAEIVNLVYPKTDSLTVPLILNVYFFAHEITLVSEGEKIIGNLLYYFLQCNEVIILF